MIQKTNPMAFRLFVVLWNQRQGLATPSVHLFMATWLESAWRAGDKRLLLMAFRSCGKSTLVGLFAAWLLYTNPDLRILVVAAETSLARRMVRNVRRIIERHPLTQNLKPKNADQWGADRFTVNRAMELRDPSMVAAGITANATGSRADVIICDDVEVPNTCDTADKRRDLRDRLAEMDFILTLGGTMLYVGTPHSWFTIYADKARSEIGEARPFLDGFRRLKIPVLDRDGHSAWPERYSAHDIARMRAATGENRFRSQMMLEPVNIAEGRLDPARLVRYGDDAVFSPELRQLHIGAARMVSCAAYWDPAFGRSGGDRSVLAIVFTDTDGNLYLHHVLYMNCDGATEDEATAQSRAVVEAVKRFHVPAVTIEINGIGRFLPAILRRELAKGRVPCAVVEHSSTRPKNIRILESFETVMAARLLRVHGDVWKTPFLTEMQDWTPTRDNGADDGLDAVAGALSLQPVRLQRLVPVSGGPTWRGGGITHEARTEFEV